MEGRLQLAELITPHTRLQLVHLQLHTSASSLFPLLLSVFLLLHLDKGAGDLAGVILEDLVQEGEGGVVVSPLPDFEASTFSCSSPSRI